MNDQSNKTHEMDFQLKAKTNSLSIKVKGTGIFIAILFCLGGITLLGIKSAEMDEPINMYLPILFLLFLGARLIAVLAALFDIVFIEK